MLKIGNLELKNNVILAPMAGYTDLPFRLLVKEISGCGLVCSEMISSDGLVRKNKKTQDLLISSKAEKPVSCQLFGNNPDIMADAGMLLEEMWADIVDLNFGCPEPKVVRSGSGSALMKNPAMLFSIVTKVRKKIKIPLTVKIRSGWDEKNINAVMIAKGCEDCGADAVVVHPRTRSQFFCGHSDWQIIKDVKSKVKIPVIGSGDIKNICDAKDMTEMSGCDGVMIGRGAIGRPWFLKQIIHYLGTGEKIEEPSLDEKINILLKHIEYFCCLKSKDKAIFEIRKSISFYFKGMFHAKLWRKELMDMQKINDVKAYLDQIRVYEKSQPV
ncbi:MAG: tRNA dihydrouridine synthase DusB [bacterium]|nr:tRNA dihydrouridine synthase DusB [bacterium]